MKSIIRKLFSAETAVVDTVGTPFYPQRLVDESGAFQVQVNQDPAGGGHGGEGRVVLEAKVSADVDDADYVIIAEIPFSDLAGSNPRSKILTDVSTTAVMRIAMRDESGVFDPDTGTRVSAWFQE
ncbi:MAG TPA: hypothetical protein VJ997_06410 [Longimicrobiales bacterium]|nr:hypothetical protein [Longimicrobiales bacterium]